MMLAHQQIQVTVMGLEGRDEYHKCYLRLGATQRINATEVSLGISQGLHGEMVKIMVNHWQIKQKLGEPLVNGPLNHVDVARKPLPSHHPQQLARPQPHLSAGCCFECCVPSFFNTHSTLEIGGKMVGKIGNGLETVGTDDAAHCLRIHTCMHTFLSQ